VTTAAAPQSRMASRSVVRSRSQYPVMACRSYLPGQKVMPTRPGPVDTAAISNGWVKEVFFIPDPWRFDGLFRHVREPPSPPPNQARHSSRRVPLAFGCHDGFRPEG
jgi:hypothetical protein